MTMKKVIIAPSILAANWGMFAEEIKNVSDQGADWIHIDVMDGHFVPPITFGPNVVEVAKRVTTLPLDVHLMIEKPENKIESFIKAGANRITVHYETCPHLHRMVEMIHQLGAKAGVAINPGTPASHLEAIIGEIDLVLLMSVNPGWGGQKFIKSSLQKIISVSELIKKSGKPVHLQVDGGINEQTCKEVVKAGADVLVAGTYIFGHSSYRQAIESLRS